MTTWRITGVEADVGKRDCAVAWRGGAVTGTAWMVARVAALAGQQCMIPPVGPTFTGSATDPNLAYWTVVSQLSTYDATLDDVTPLLDDTPPGSPN